jgi:hypothetical protein
VGSARVYVKVDGPFSYESWIDGLRADRSFVTSGPLLFLTVNGRPVGSKLDVEAGAPLRVEARAVSRDPIGNLQIVSNGEVVRTLRTDDRDAAIAIDMAADESMWFAARCSPTDNYAAIRTAEDYYTARPNIAHTSATYVDVAGRPVFDPAAARTLIERMERHAADIAERGNFANDAQRAEAVGHVEEGIRLYRGLLEHHETGKGEVTVGNRS